MIFKQMLPGQKLILVRIETRQPATRPIIARSARRPDPEPAIVQLILWLLLFFAPTCYALRHTWGAIRTNYAALVFLASITAAVLLETLAAGYIQKMVGA